MQERYLISMVVLLAATISVSAVETPHESVDQDCELCHTTTSFQDVRFDHGQTGFPLDAGHSRTECVHCHTLKDFSEVEMTCRTCHSDIHEAKLGPDCADCHSPVSWTVLDIQTIHYDSDFPIIGRHAQVDCIGCHPGLPRGDLSFNTTRCVECHQNEYLSVANPNHVVAGLHTDCRECHQMNGWRPAMLPEHDVFFPIYSGEHRSEWEDCSTCHTDPNTFQTFTCLVCHDHARPEMDETHDGISGYAYNSSDCYLCHPAGKKGNFVAHDAIYFPIFSGRHKDQWSDCRICHNVPSVRQHVDCLTCHEHNQSAMDGAHGNMAGYVYNSDDCYFCHPTGLKGEFVAHDGEFFPIFTGIHAGEWGDCSACHPNSAQREETDCLTCHEHNRTDTDAHHGSMAGYNYDSQDCYLCHPNGQKGQFTSHDGEFFPIFSGTHQGEWNSCQECHTTPGNRKPVDCLVCHERNKTDGDHGSMSGYVYNSDDCYFCHPRGEKGQFTGHDGEFFPIFTGTHSGEWSACTDCHTVPDDRKIFNCLNCHGNTVTTGFHGGMSGYAYSSPACYDCHPTGQRGQYVLHDTEFFPIFSGPHGAQWNDCATCHTDPTNRAQFFCFNCHEHNRTDMDAQHGSMAGYNYDSQDCYLCHPNGQKGQFTSHDGEFFPIFSGTHQGQWSDCTVCHSTPGDRKPVDCLPCHDQTTTDGAHGGMAGYAYVSDDCYFCHPTGERGQFVSHDGEFFPIFSGTHDGQWANCTDCHTTPNDRTMFDCLTCHVNPTVDNFHAGMPGYSYSSAACYDCHPTGQKGSFVDHDAQYFPVFTGLHSGAWDNCATCHTDPMNRAEFFCFNCHQHNRTDMDAQHGGMAGYVYNSEDCYFCHPTGLKGEFVAHDGEFFPVFSGMHQGQWTNCDDCHTTPNDRSLFDCLPCHERATMDGAHGNMAGYVYNSDDCYFCHPTGLKGEFLAHDGDFFPIFSGMHQGQWINCDECHTTPNDRSLFNCLDCHTNPTTDGIHGGMNGYSYTSAACYDCHPTGAGGQFVDHDAQFFPIFSGKHNSKWSSCATCHVDPADRSVFYCFDCHVHNQTKMDDKHSSEQGYSYDSYVCYGCHPRGEG